MKTAASAAVKALQATATNFSKEDFAKASAKSKFAAASALESRDGFINVLGSRVRLVIFPTVIHLRLTILQVLAGSDATATAVLTPLESVTSASVSKAATNLFKTKPTFVAIGDLTSLPYSDEIGL